MKFALLLLSIIFFSAMGLFFLFSCVDIIAGAANGLDHTTLFGYKVYSHLLLAFIILLICCIMGFSLSLEYLLYDDPKKPKKENSHFNIH